ncbi:hypothetical protein [Actinoplanes couchii]|uniref:hypothetical protein n=1 Tax=Actinoplanes couchii TaxID=403638 RepID=UPI00194071AB|nr:hypothetical protein [Actinoplanes couchii]MDR6316226.1 type II secretory pathway predicted ATPase ExeA [Actinoplanes couchii]
MATIPTPALQRAVAELEGYLAADGVTGSGADTPPGRVLAVIGDYGTGKTHLVNHLMSTARKRGGPAVEQVYLNAPAGTFVDLYRAFAYKLNEQRDLVLSRVRHFYAEVVANDLGDSEFFAELVRRLRAGEADPVEVVRELNLAEISLLEEVQQRLSQVTENKAFGSALTLLLRNGFEDAVWEWFQGKVPDRILQERGITFAIVGSEQTALEAMGVFALLIGYRSFHFMVVVDELDQLLSAAGHRENDHNDEAQSAFKHLMQVFESAGAFLVLAGLPDFLRELRDDVGARITRRIGMQPLTAADAEAYIRMRQGSDDLFPFTPETVGYVVDVTDGSPRRIVSLCYHLYARAREQDGPVNGPMIRAVAQEELYAPSTERMHTEIQEVLLASGLETIRNRFLNGTPVDYWIAIGAEGAGIAVLARQDGLDAGQRADLQVQVSRLFRPDRQVLVVFGGHVPQSFVTELRLTSEQDPIVYDRLHFMDRFAAAIKGMEVRLERSTGGDQGGLLLSRVTRLIRQQSNVLEIVHQLSGSMDAFRDSTGERLDAIERRVGDRPGTETVALPVDDRTGLPVPVAALFDDVIGTVGVDGPLAGVFRRTFDGGPAGIIARRQVNAMLPRGRASRATGQSVLIRVLTEAFRSEVVDWYAVVRNDPDGQPAAGSWQRLDDLVATFDTQIALVAKSDIGWLVAQLSDASADESMAAIQDALVSLSARVKAEVLTGFTTG